MDSGHGFSIKQVIHHKIGGRYYGQADSPPLSLKCMFNGSAFYKVGKSREYSLDDSSYLILNAGTPYTIIKDSETPVETFCVFFPPWMLPLLLRGLSHSDQKLLDDGGGGEGGVYGFSERRFPHGKQVTQRIFLLRHFSSLISGRNSIQTAAPDSFPDHLLWLEEQVYDLLRLMLADEKSLEQKIAALPAARHSTRRELYRRIYWARDYMHANQGAALSLSEIAAVASLSPYHFLRRFRELFHCTPHAYLSQMRMQKAADLLSHTRKSVTEIALEVGFQSLPSFIHLFKRTTGLTPLAYRQQEK